MPSEKCHFPRRIGLTGGIATGKSTVTHILRKWGYTVLDADAEAHALMEPGGAVSRAIEREFGRELLDEEGRVDRKRLSRFVFGNPSLLEKLNRCTHPIIYQSLRENLVKVSTKGVKKDILYIDLPLLFETLEQARTLSLDSIWVISADYETQLRRLQARNGWSRDEAEQRIRAQWPLAEKERRADRVIHNDTTPADLEAKLLRAIEEEGNA